jgi:hypothetical protein
MLISPEVEWLEDILGAQPSHKIKNLSKTRMEGKGGYYPKKLEWNKVGFQLPTRKHWSSTYSH